MEFLPTNALGHIALTLQEATDVQTNYAHLTGQHYQENGLHTGNIVCVAIAPFDELNKWLFLEYFTSSKDPVKAISFYQPPFFDVILIVQSLKDKKLSFVDVRSYEAATAMSA